MKYKIFAPQIALLVAGCTQPEASEPVPDFVVENALSGDSVILWNGEEQRYYEIKLACISEANGAESRHVLLGNLEAANRISFTPIGEMKAIGGTPQTYALTAEVFVDLGDGPQSVNEAQLLAGQALLRKDATPQNCPRLEAMKQAQQEAKDYKGRCVGKYQIKSCGKQRTARQTHIEFTSLEYQSPISIVPMGLCHLCG